MNATSSAGLKLPDRLVVAECLQQMAHVRDQLWSVRGYALHEVARTDGFRGIFEILAPALDDLAGAFDVVGRGLVTRYDRVIEAVEESAHQLRGCDDEVEVSLLELHRDVGLGR